MSELTLAVVIVFCLLFAAVAVCVALLINNRMEMKRIEKWVCNPDSWCADNCLIHAKCFANSKDTGEAFKRLEHYCNNCPIAKAFEITFEQ